MNLSPQATRALINANTQNGSLPQGTPTGVTEELREAGLIARTSMTIRGRATRRRLMDNALEEL